MKKSSETSVFCFFIIVIMQFCFTPCEAGAEKRQIVLAAVDLKPFYSKDLPDEGYYSEIAHIAFDRAGYRLTVKYAPFKRAVAQARTGYYDGVMGLVYNDERAGIFAFTDAIDNVNQSFYGLKGHGIVFTSLDDLKGYRIGVHRGTNYANALIQHGGLSVSEVTSDAQNIKKLLLGRISLMLVEVHHIRYLINRQFPDKADKFELVKPPFKVLPLHIAVTKSKYPDHASIVADFNRELKKMHDDGTFARIVKKHESE